jgi:hypothetical protein
MGELVNAIINGNGKYGARDWQTQARREGLMRAIKRIKCWHHDTCLQKVRGIVAAARKISSLEDERKALPKKCPTACAVKGRSSQIDVQVKKQEKRIETLNVQLEVLEEKRMDGLKAHYGEGNTHIC